MGQIKVEKNAGGIEGLCVIEPKVFGDSRGYFVETYNKQDMGQRDWIWNLYRIISPSLPKGCFVVCTSKSSIRRENLCGSQRDVFLM